MFCYGFCEVFKYTFLKTTSSILNRFCKLTTRNIFRWGGLAVGNIMQFLFVYFYRISLPILKKRIKALDLQKQSLPIWQATIEEFEIAVQKELDVSGAYISKLLQNLDSFEAPRRKEKIRKTQKFWFDVSTLNKSLEVILSYSNSCKKTWNFSKVIIKVEDGT